MNKILTLITVIWCILQFSSGVHAQNQDGFCLDFEQFQAGDRIGAASDDEPGSTISRIEDIKVTLERFSYPDGTSGYGNVLVFQDTFFNPQAPNTYLFPSNINLAFDFSALPDETNSVCLDYYYWGGDVNISVNGEQLFIASNLEEFLALNGKEIAAGVKIEFLPETDRKDQGTICLFGPIKSLLIGGQEFGIDNVCAYVNDVNDVCSITDLVAKPHPCTPNDIFYVDVDFNLQDGETSGKFGVIINNQQFGPFEYLADSFLSVGPVKTFGDEEFLVTVYDLDNNSCSAKTRFTQVCSIDCDLEDIKVYVEYCPEDGIRPQIVVDFDPKPGFTDLPVRFTLDQQFTAVLNSRDFPFRLPMSGDIDLDKDLSFKICFTLPNGQECCVEGEIILLPCERDNCIDFENIGPDTLFDASTNQVGDVLFEEDGVPVSIHELYWASDAIEPLGQVLISDRPFNGFPTAQGKYAFLSGASLQFNFDSLDKKVTQVCLDFYDGGGSKNLSINGIDIVIGDNFREIAEKEFPGLTLSFSESTNANSIRSGNLCIRGEIKTLRIGGGELAIDNICFETAPDNGDCSISNLVAEAGECQDDGTFYAKIKFEWGNPGDSGYTVSSLDGRDLGVFKYDQRFPVVGPFKGNNTRQGIIVRDNANRVCADTVYLPAKECSPVCIIAEMDARVIECLDNGNFNIKIRVAYTRGYEGAPYYATVEGKRYGPFDDHEVLLENVEVNTDATVFSLKVCPISVTTDVNQECCLSIELKKDCPAPCPMLEISADVQECLPNGNYNLLVKIGARNNNEDFTFGLYVDGKFIDRFQYSDTPLELKNIPVYTDGESFEIKACVPSLSSDSTELCCVSTTLRKPDCPAPCPVEGIKAEVLRCLPNGNYDVLLKLDVKHNTQEFSFLAYVEGELLGRYTYQGDPIELSNIEVNTDALNFELTICVPQTISGSTDECCFTSTLRKPDCPNPCILEGLKVEITKCYTTGEFDLLVHVDASADTSGHPIDLFIEGEHVGSYELSAFPVELKEVFIATKALDFEVMACQLATAGAPNRECCVSTQVWKSDCPAPSGDCISFDDQPTQSYGAPDYQPGDEVFETQGISIKVFSLQNLDWSSSFDKFSVLARDDLADFQKGDGQIIYHQGISSIYNFSNYAEPVEQVRIDYYNTGTHLNLAANGSQIQILSILAPGFHQLGNGVELEIIWDNNDGSQGQMIFHGNIQTLMIGGDQLALDNLCLNTRKACEIGDLVLEAGDCQADGSFYIKLDFDYKNTSNYFIVKENGQGIAKFAYDELPVKLGPFRTPYEAGSTFQVYDSANEDCGSIARFGPYFCERACAIKEVKAYDFECDLEKGVYHMTVSIEGENLGDILTLKTWGGYLMRFRYEGKPFRVSNVPLNDSLVDGFTICAGLQPNDAFACCFEIEYRVPCNLDCSIYGIETYDFECFEDGTYSLSIKIKAENTSGKYYLKTFGGHEIEFEAPEGKARLDHIPFKGDTFVDGFTIYDRGNRDCNYETRYEVPCYKPCGLYGLKVRDVSCNNDSTYNLILALVGRGTTLGQWMYLRTKSGFEKRFKWEGQAIKIEGIPNLGWGEDGLQVCMEGVDDCCQETSYEVPCTIDDPCRLGELFAVATPCADDGSYYLEVDFKYEQTSDGFEVYVDGQSYGKHRYSELPLRIGPFYQGIVPTEYHELTIKDLEKDCKASTKVRPCQANGCQFSAVQVEPVDCADGQFYAKVKYRVNDPNGRGFLIFAEGQLFGPYAYESDEQIVLGPFSADGVTSYDFLFVDLDDPTCFGYVEIDPVSCEEDCKITEARAEILDCKADGTYQVKIDFKYESANNEYFDILTNNARIIGTYKLSDLPVVVELPLDPNEVGLQICINDNPNCCIETDIIWRPCPPICDGIAFRANPTECNEDGQFKIELKLDIDLTVIYPVIIEVNGRFYDSVQVANPQFSIGPFKAGESYTVSIIDGWRRECKSSIELGVVECEQDCQIRDLAVEVLDCEPNGAYRVLVDFNYHGDSTEVFHLINADGNVLKRFSLSDLPLKIDDIRFDSGAQYLGICNEDQTCCERIYVEFPPCTNCGISRADDVFADCDENGNFYVRIKADWDVTNLDRFIVTQGDIAYPIEADDEGLVRVGPFPSNDSSVYVLEITDLVNPSCVVKVEVGPFACKDDDLWPGDANLDNVANHLDLLSLGLVWGKEGPIRLAANTDWSATPAPRWGDRFSSGGDLKHADCNGDGVIDEQDIAIIRRNYGQTHGELKDAIELPGTDFDPPIFFDLPEGEHLSDTSFFEIPIVLGTKEQKVNDIYGVAFTIEFDPSVINPNDIEIIYPASWLGEPGVNLQSLDYTYLGDGKIEIAITRTDQNEVSGYGTVAYFRGIRDDIVGRHEAEIDISKSHAIDASQQLIRIQGLKAKATFNKPQDPPRQHGLIDLRNGMRVYPNPASDRVFVRNIFNVPVEALQVLTTDGRIMSPVHNNVSELNVSSLPKGLYILRIQMGGFNIHHKIFKN